jgi:hypothetical protein
VHAWPLRPTFLQHYNCCYNEHPPDITADTGCFVLMPGSNVQDGPIHFANIAVQQATALTTYRGTRDTDAAFEAIARCIFPWDAPTAVLATMCLLGSITLVDANDTWSQLLATPSIEERAGF